MEEQLGLSELSVILWVSVKRGFTVYCRQVLLYICLVYLVMMVSRSNCYYTIFLTLRPVACTGVLTHLFEPQVTQFPVWTGKVVFITSPDFMEPASCEYYRPSSTPGRRS